MFPHPDLSLEIILICMCCYFYLGGQNIVSFKCFTTSGSVNSYTPVDLQAIAFGLSVISKKMKGRYLPPSRSISSFIIFIAAAIIFIVLLHRTQHISCQLNFIHINHRIMVFRAVQILT